MPIQKKILIAEENGEFLRNMLNAFRGFGFECITVAKDGAEVINAIEKFSPDIVVMESFMARFDALAVMQRMQAMKMQKSHVLPFLSIQ